VKSEIWKEKVGDKVKKKTEYNCMQPSVVLIFLKISIFIILILRLW